MEILFTTAFWSSLFAIIVIDLVLAGDNAIVIGLAARKLPKEQQTKAIVWGTLGAVVIRALATLAVVWLLKIPGLLLIGGCMLVWIAYRLLCDQKEKNEIKAGDNLWAAIRTVIIADAVMGLDNVIAVAGAAHGDPLLVIVGLLVSVPIMVWGSTLILKIMERFPVVIYFGAGVLAWTAADMIIKEPLVSRYIAASPLLEWGLSLILVAGVLLLGRIKNQPHRKEVAEQS
ncbi:TerC family protein [Brevibacillus sp. SYP-B805]|uniref:TerC family protein n=1 Tax=Brevibacillus sp. SYP-B805 TaxID=1578199 RepID=UPI0013EB3E16|nr:TerC family protein [Brevibacillus sp. SYP-B805]NGQ94235.1 TerC family protein [Brevibacillus sp. SYP-B805]